MLDSNQEVEEVSFIEKLGNALYSMCTGILLFFVLLGVAGWNEYRNVAEMRTIAAGRDAFKEATCSINSKLNGELVHASCNLANMTHLGKNIDGLKFKSAAEMTGLSLKTSTEVYAWTESVSEKKTTNKVGGGDTIVKTYTYSQGWTTSSPQAVSSFFKAGEECKKQNKGIACVNIDAATDPDLTSATAKANNIAIGSGTLESSVGVKFGEYNLPADMTSRLGSAEVIRPVCVLSRRHGFGDIEVQPADAMLAQAADIEGIDVLRRRTIHHVNQLKEKYW